MPRIRRNAAASKAVETVEPVEPEEQVNLEEEPEEAMEEEVEYEEIEEEVEEEEEEEVVEEEEDDEEEVEEEEVVEEEEDDEEVEEEVEEEEVVEEDEDDEEVEEEVEEEEVVEEEEDDEEEEEETTTNGGHPDATTGGDSSMKADEEDERDENEIKEHAELLALPPHGSEVYIGKFTPDATEEDLKSFCESVGEVTEVRMMKRKDSSENKDFAFVTFRTKELATKAIKDLNDTELKGKKIKCCSTSLAKNQLFIGDVPRDWVQDDLKKAVTKVGPGVINVNLMKIPKKSNRNRGYAFVDYYNHACAEYARNKMSSPEFKLDNNTPTVGWAAPKNGDSSSNSQIKTVYVRNLPMDVTQDQLRKLFKHHGEIARVELPSAKYGQEKRFGFVHFAKHSSAMKALKKTEKYELRGDILKCTLAKPPSSDKKVESGSNSQKGSLLPNFAPRGYVDMGGAFGGLAPGFALPMMYGRGQAPGGMAMVPKPMILPDGHIGYVLQQPGAPMPPQQQVGDRSGAPMSPQQQTGGRSGAPQPMPPQQQTGGRSGAPMPPQQQAGGRSGAMMPPQQQAGGRSGAAMPPQPVPPQQQTGGRSGALMPPQQEAVGRSGAPMPPQPMPPQQQTVGWSGAPMPPQQQAGGRSGARMPSQQQAVGRSGAPMPPQPMPPQQTVVRSGALMPPQQHAGAGGRSGALVPPQPMPPQQQAGGRATPMPPQSIPPQHQAGGWATPMPPQHQAGGRSGAPMPPPQQAGGQTGAPMPPQQACGWSGAPIPPQPMPPRQAGGWNGAPMPPQQQAGGRSGGSSSGGRIGNDNSRSHRFQPY